MSFTRLMQGVSLGMVIASAAFWLAQPTPVVSVEAPVTRGTDDVIATEFAYNRFAPLPELIVRDQKHRDLLHRSVRRVTLPNGEDGVRILLLMDGPRKTDWI